MVSLGIDYGRLARIAAKSKLHEVANYLISFEPRLENKIPFFYERQNYPEALRLAIETGDPNEVSKVFNHILSLSRGDNPRKSLREVVKLVIEVADGPR